jgi:hypothetical protein
VIDVAAIAPELNAINAESPIHTARNVLTNFVIGN